MVVREASGGVACAHPSELAAEEKRTRRSHDGVGGAGGVPAPERRRLRVVAAASGADPESRGGAEVELRPRARRFQRLVERREVLPDATAAQAGQCLTVEEFAAQIQPFENGEHDVARNGARVYACRRGQEPSLVNATPDLANQLGLAPLRAHAPLQVRTL